ncbi:replication initiator protein A [Enterococcus faecalis]|uniref:replication initiator protein A n=1 Tax=Enterococcus faecalis TaxID=1351 RepID=UPI0018C319D1|nr:replication initiator protein A [Enterococcus faecalis]MBG0302707.1 replication initiator protein A [Enterococcus faecalis]MBJ0404852.1 replication initiator protein A [Enterococcus faecalis]MBJ0425318.1 replication initiator protein A [Enterococcus faecalis]MBJ0432071.1 replication initiator protein A [Enterococcus faecalis]MBJ1164192.1 replication initiator protein A [Enterococcus faecalis]
MSAFKFYTTDEVYGETFFKLPKVFFTNPLYINMSNDAKIAYAILKDRFQYSIKNNWVNENKQIYFIYTNKELMSILNCHEGKLNKIKKELQNAELLFQERLGLKKPNRLYLGKPEATATDVYIQNQENFQEKEVQSIDNKGNAKIAFQEKEVQSIDNKGNAKIAFQEKEAQSIDNKGNAKIAHNQYKELKNIDTYKDTVIDTTKEELQNRELLQSFSETQDHTFLDKRCLELIALFSNTIQEAHNAVGIIIRAKNKQEKKYGRVLIAEDWQEEIETTLRKVYHKIKTDAKIKNVHNYMFGAFCTTFENCLIQLQSWEQKNESQTVVTLHDWVEKK